MRMARGSNTARAAELLPLQPKPAARKLSRFDSWMKRNISVFFHCSVALCFVCILCHFCSFSGKPQEFHLTRRDNSIIPRWYFVLLLCLQPRNLDNTLHGNGNIKHEFYVCFYNFRASRMGKVCRTESLLIAKAVGGKVNFVIEKSLESCSILKKQRREAKSRERNPQESIAGNETFFIKLFALFFSVGKETGCEREKISA